MCPFKYFQGGSKGYEGLGAVPGGTIDGLSGLTSGIWEGHLDTTFRG